MLLDDPLGGRRRITTRYVVGAAVVLALSFFTVLYGFTDFQQSSWNPLVSSRFGSGSGSSIAQSIPNNLRNLAKDHLTPVDASYFVTAAGETIGVPSTIWNQSLGARVCIADIDTRSLHGVNQVWSPEEIDWNKTDTVTPGRINHYAYSLIHGYDYRYVQARDSTTRWKPWQKIPPLADLLRQYDVVVSVDADVVFPSLHLPIELLLNHWQLGPHLSVSMPTDVDQEVLKDSHGRLMQNAGITILFNNPTTFEILDRWYNCPTEIEGCAKLTKVWPAEQGAFDEYIRYKFADSVGEFPCEDAIGYPPEGIDGCYGRIVRHYTLDKNGVKPAVAEALGIFLSKVLQADMFGSKGDLYLDMTNSSAYPEISEAELEALNEIEDYVPE